MPSTYITPSEIETHLNTVFRRFFNDPGLEINENTTAADIADWDSLNHIYLIVEIEKEFKVKFTLSEVQSLGNVGGLIQLIARKRERA